MMQANEDLEANVAGEAAGDSNDVNLSNYDDEDSEPPAQFTNSSEGASKADAALGGTPQKDDSPQLHLDDTMRSSPSKSTNSGEDLSLSPMSPRQQRMRIVKCYGLVALVVMVCAIGIPLGAVVLFKNKNQEMSFSGSTSGQDASNVASTQETVVATPEQVETEYPKATEEATDASEATDATTVETPTITVDETEATLATDFATHDSPWDIINATMSLTDAGNMTESFNFTDPMTDATEITTDATEIATDTTEITTDATDLTLTEQAPATSVPTPSLTLAMTPNPAATGREAVYFTLVNVTSPGILQDLSTPQAHAYKWVATDDKILPIPTGQKLVQRYALAALDLSLHQPFSTAFSDANKDECEWLGVVCDETGEVTELRWNRQQLNGALAAEMKLLSKLQFLDLSENNIGGSVEAIYEVLPLKYVHLYRNNFTGGLTEQIGLLDHLDTLNLGFNQLTGRIPLSLRTVRGSPKPLRFLVLHHNKFSGQIPFDWRIRTMYYLDLAHNELTGPLPTDWNLNAISLRHLFLSHNKLTGTIPEYFAQLGKGRMKSMFLDNNQFSGGVPTGWGPVDQLASLAVYNNNLTMPLDPAVCALSVFEAGNLVEMRTDCSICDCRTLCHTCIGIKPPTAIAGNNTR